ncbi:Tyrosine-tRNA ligase [Trinorchestia longiramus]|nr:Tyrosine-tRNA ligase [Trinorchestia longiramus]
MTSKQRVYAGFDPTADSLHIGNLLVILALLHCREAGHTPIILLGGFTSFLGDPSGRTDKRAGLSAEASAANLIRIQQSIETIFDNHSKIFWKSGEKEPLPDVVFVDNNKWMKNVKFSRLLQIFELLKMKNLLKSSFVRERIDKRGSHPLNLMEFLYQACQAYDWLHLYDKYQCKIQIGGSDQLANIMVGHDLIRDARGDSTCTGLTTPLLLGPYGEKLGKSMGNSVWLCSDRTSCFDFYQYFLRKKDSEVENLLKLLTLIPVHDITKIMEKHWEKPEALTAQKMLAESLTLLVHGEHGLSLARASTAILYQQQATALLDLSPSELESLFSGSVLRLTLDPGTTVMQAAMMARCFKSERECEEIILAGGFHINQHPVREPHMVLVPDAHILPTGYSLFRVGKKQFTLVAWNSFSSHQVHS